VTEVVKVSSKSSPNAVAGALAAVVRSDGRVEIQVVGAGALNQAIKAIAIARTYLGSSGLDLSCRPTFADIDIDGESRTAIRLLVESDRLHGHAAGIDLEAGRACAALPASPAAALPAR
jgi:stage V sporulation protein S